MQKGIQKRQNDEWSLKKLAAQRYLYQQAKITENWRLVSVLFVAGVLVIGLAVKSDVFDQWATVTVVLMWLIDQEVMMRRVTKKKEEAAAIQEDFDCFVLDLPWPDHLGITRPIKDRVKELSKRAAQADLSEEKLKNWYYPDGIPSDEIAARLHCQKINCHWDSRLRGEWIRLVRIFVISLLVVGVVLAIVFEMTFLNVLLLLATGIRLLAWLFMEQHAHSFAEKRIKHLHKHLSQPDSKDSQMALCDVRLVQAALFDHRRVCPNVPDWFYRIKKKTYEEMVRG